MTHSLGQARETQRKFTALVAALAVLIGASVTTVANATNNSWLSAVNGDWSDGTKWSQNASPISTDDASIGFNTITVTFNTNATVNSLTSAAALQLNGGTLAGAQSSAASSVAVTDGTLSLNGAVLSNLTLAAGGGTISVSGNSNNQFNGIIINHDLALAASGYVQVFGANTLNSTISLAGGGNGIQLRDGNALLTISATGVIHGSAAIFSAFGGTTVADNGVINADQNGNTLALNASDITGSGILTATNGGVLSIGGTLNGTGLKVNVDNSPGSLVKIDGGNLSGTLASTTGSGLSFSGNSNNMITTAAIKGDLTFAGSAYAQVFGANTLDGTIHMAGTANGIQLRDGNAVLTVNSGGAIRGFGSIFQSFGGATLTNNGIVSADTSAQILAINPSNITGSGTFEAKNGGVVSIGGLLNGSNAVVHVDGNASSAVLIDGGGLTGSFAASTGTGISFSGNSNNSITTASIVADLTFTGAAYAQVFGANTLDGTIHMAGTANGIQLRDGNAVLTVNSGGAIRGFGAIFQSFGGATLTNNGIVSADTSGQTLALNPSNITGSGTFEAKNGGVLSIGGLLNGTSAIVHVDGNANSAVVVNGGGLTGSFAASTGAGISFAGNGNNTITSASIAADLTFNGAGYAQVFSTNTLDGTIHMAGTSNGIQLRDSNAVLTVNSGGAIRGFGAIFQSFGGATLTNNGIVSADTSGQTLTLSPSNIGGSGTFEAKNGGVLSIAGLLNGNHAVVHVDNNASSAVLVNGGGLSGTFAASTGTGISFANNGNNTISSATIDADLTFTGAAYAQWFGANIENGAIHMAGTANGIQLRDSNAMLTIGPTGSLQGYGMVFETFGGTHLSNQGTIAVNVAGQTLSLNNSFVDNAGNLSVRNQSILQIGGAMSQSAGQATIDGTLNLSQPLALNGGVLGGAGTIIGNVNNNGGHLAPGNPPNVLKITGNYSQFSGSELDIKLGGTTPGVDYNQLSVSGAANVAGTIDVDLVNNFLPFVGEQFDVVLRGSGSGVFSSTISDDPGLTYTVNYQTDRVTITITAVPEPSAMVLAASAAGLVMLWRWRNRQRA